MAKLGPLVRRLSEKFPGACAQAPSQKGAQSGCWQRPHQLDDGKLADASKAEAACQIKYPMLGMSLARLPFSKGLPFQQNLLRKVVTIKKWDRKKQIA